MAREVQAVMPEVVARESDGYLQVFYDKLGLKLQIDQWVASGEHVPAGAARLGPPSFTYRPKVDFVWSCRLTPFNTPTISRVGEADIVEVTSQSFGDGHRRESGGLSGRGGGPDWLAGNPAPYDLARIGLSSVSAGPRRLPVRSAVIGRRRR